MHSKNKLKKPEDGIFTNIYHCKGLIMILILFNISEIKGNCKEKIPKKSLYSCSDDDLLEKCWEKFSHPEEWKPFGDYMQDLHFSPLDSVLKSSFLANLNKLNKKTLLSKLSSPIPVSNIESKFKI